MARFIPVQDPETGRFLPSGESTPPERGQVLTLPRRTSDRSNPDNPSNPVLFGEDLGDLAWEALGAGLVAAANDQVVTPFIKGVVPLHNDIAGKLLDAGTTAGTALVAGGVIGFVDNPVGRKVRRGGMLLAVARGITAFLPGFSLSAQFPIHFPALGAPPVPTPGVTGGTAASGVATPTGGTLALTAGPDQTRYPPYSQYARGLASNLNAGL